MKIVLFRDDNDTILTVTDEKESRLNENKSKLAPIEKKHVKGLKHVKKEIMKYNPLREEATSTVFRTKLYILLILIIFIAMKKKHFITLPTKSRINKHETYHEHEKLWKNFKSSHIEESKRSSFDVQENSKSNILTFI